MGLNIGGLFGRGPGIRAIKASAAETASTTHRVTATGQSSVVGVTVAVSAASGTTPTMTVVVEGSQDNSNWTELGTIGANGYRAGSTGTAPSNITGAGTHRGIFPAARFIRTRSVIGGTTPSFTYSVTADLA